MKHVPNIAAILTIALTAICAGTAEAGTIEAFRDGDAKAAWANESGQLVLSLVTNVATKKDFWGRYDLKDVCGAETGAVTSEPANPFLFEFDMNGGTIHFLVPGMLADVDAETGHKVVFEDLTINTAGTGWRHVKLTGKTFSRKLPNGNRIDPISKDFPNRFSTIIILNEGSNMLRNFTVMGEPLNINTRTSDVVALELTGANFSRRIVPIGKESF